MKCFGVQIDNNTSGVCIHRCFSVCFATVAVKGLMTTVTLYFHLTVSFWVSLWGSVSGSKNIFSSKTESLQYWHI